MTVEIGSIQALYRYPVKSMAGEALEQAPLGWHGLAGDRRFAFRRVSEQGGFPWLTASKVPALIRYQPHRLDNAPDQHHPTHVLTPDGQVLELRSNQLLNEIAGRYGAEVELMQLKQGIFDEAPISLITLATSEKITGEAGKPADIRRFRPNIVIDTGQNDSFTEDQWVGKTLVFGDAADSPAVHVTMRDERCVMVNLQPDTAQSDPAVLKTVVQLNQNCAGVYATVLRPGTLTVGQTIHLK